MTNQITPNYAKSSINILSNRDKSKRSLHNKQRELRTGILKQAFTKYYDSNTRKFDIDHADLADCKAHETVLDAMLEWEYADRELQEIEREFQTTWKHLASFGSQYVWTGMDSDGMYTHEIEWKRLEDIARGTTKADTLFVDETEESLANRGL